LTTFKEKTESIQELWIKSYKLHIE
jgi:hypothetical protein